MPAYKITRVIVQTVEVDADSNANAIAWACELGEDDFNLVSDDLYAEIIDEDG